MKKDPIDKLFEDKLKDYSDIPDEKIWKAIEASLDKKRKSRKVIPIWWKFGGAAAVLVLFFYLFSPTGADTAPESKVSDTEELIRPQTDRPGALPEDTIDLQNVEGTVTDVSEDKGAPSPRESEPGEKPGTAGQTAGNEALKATGTVTKPSGTAVAETQKKALPLIKDTERPAEQVNNAAIATREKQEATEGAANAQLAHNDRDKATQEAGEISETDALPEVSPLKEAMETEGQLAETEQEQPAKKSLYDEIVEAAEREKDRTSNEESRWAVGPRVAPVYFSSFGEGSPIHSSFAANPKSGNVNFSYGMSVSYNISPKLSIRSGVHKVEYGYDTNDISFSPSFAATAERQINTIDYALTSRNLVVQNASEAKVSQDALSAEVTADFPARSGRMVQQFGYVEVPLELNLALVDRKLGLHLIGGLSSLFLVDNNVILESEGNATQMGEANNLNPVNFSTNIGVGLQYEVSPKLQLNLEPVFKYQLNTFSEAAGSFNPYSVGVYSGLNFKF